MAESGTELELRADARGHSQDQDSHPTRLKRSVLHNRRVVSLNEGQHSAKPLPPVRSMAPGAVSTHTLMGKEVTATRIQTRCLSDASLTVASTMSVSGVLKTISWADERLGGSGCQGTRLPPRDFRRQRQEGCAS